MYDVVLPFSHLHYVSYTGVPSSICQDGGVRDGSYGSRSWSDDILKVPITDSSVYGYDYGGTMASTLVTLMVAVFCNPPSQLLHCMVGSDASRDGMGG